MNTKWKDCIRCICIECNQHHGTDIDECRHSDCKWCSGEIGEYTQYCRQYEEKEEVLA